MVWNFAAFPRSLMRSRPASHGSSHFFKDGKEVRPTRGIGSLGPQDLMDLGIKSLDLPTIFPSYSKWYCGLGPRRKPFGKSILWGATASPRYRMPTRTARNRANFGGFSLSGLIAETKWRAIQEETLNWEITVMKAFIPETDLNVAVFAAFGGSHVRLTTAEIVNDVLGSTGPASLTRRQIRNCLYNLERSGFVTRDGGNGDEVLWTISGRVRPEERRFIFPLLSKP